MNIPGFTAEAAVYKTQRQYYLAGTGGVSVQSQDGSVTMQLRRSAFGRSGSGNLLVGSGLGFLCIGSICFCSDPDSDDCKGMFGGDTCGPVAQCNEYGCWCIPA